MKFISVLLAEVLSAKLLRAGARDENLMFISSTGSSRLAEKLEAGKKENFHVSQEKYKWKIIEECFLLYFASSTSKLLFFSSFRAEKAERLTADISEEKGTEFAVLVGKVLEEGKEKFA